MLDGRSQGPGWLLRGVYAYEVIKHGDKVLDIGCGDGFFTRNFLAPRAAHVDAVDIESSAIEEAQYRNADEKIFYAKSDAVTDKFPSDRYDVVVWDGAIGHFARETSEAVLSKIAAALSVGGIFCGSETLGTEGSDHLQYFKEPTDLAGLLSQAFQHVWMKIESYPINNGFMRTEAYWRCSSDPDARHSADWRKVSGHQNGPHASAF